MEELRKEIMHLIEQIKTEKALKALHCAAALIVKNQAPSQPRE